MLTNSLSRLSEYSWSRAYEPNPALENSRAARLAYLLFLLDLVFMIRGFALSNIIELILFSLFIFSPTLRLEFLKAIKDRAVFFLAIFYLWVFLSGFWSTAVWMDILHNWLGWRKILLVPIGFVVLNSRKKAQTACYTLLLMGVVYLTVALVDLFGFGALWGRPYHSVAQDANVQGGCPI